jgi:thiamine biosynthesis lipoprotein
LVIAAERDVRSTLPPTVRRDYARLEFQAMGTACALLFEAPSYAEAAAFKHEAAVWTGSFENMFSRFKPDSLVSRINASGTDWVELVPEAESLFALCDWFYWSTQGIFDPAMLPVISLWDYHSPTPVVPTDEEVTNALTHCGWRNVERHKGKIRLTKPGMGIDVGGIGKEYAVDRVFEMGRKRGLRHLMVDFGHDLRVCGEPPEGGAWRVGLENPLHPGRCWGGVAVTDHAVTTSGDYARGFKAPGGSIMGHILDPRTGRPVSNGCRSVSVIAPTCTEAGVIATSAFILGHEAGLALIDGHYGVEGCIWHENKIYESRRFNEYAILN